MTLDVRSLACGDRDVCEMGGELIRLDVYSWTLSSLEDNLKMANKGRNL